MKTTILLIIFIFVNVGASAQQDTDIALKTEFITLEKQSKPTVVNATAELAKDINSRELHDGGLTVRQITVEKSTTPDYSIKASAELATDENLKTAKMEENQLESVEIILEPKSKPSGIKATVIRAQ